MAETNLGGGVGIGYKSVEFVKKAVVTSAQVLALNGTPITIVDAPSSTLRGDVLLEFMGAVIHKPAGTAYAGIATGENLVFKLTNASGAAVSFEVETEGFLDQATAQTRLARPVATEYVPVRNAALVLHLLAGEITTGTSPLIVTLQYREWRNTSVQEVQ